MKSAKNFWNVYGARKPNFRGRVYEMAVRIKTARISPPAVLNRSFDRHI
jgi:hypothetical protein